MNWFMDNIGTIAVIFILAVIVLAIILKIIKDRKQGKSSCGCNCAHCAMAGQCHKKPESDNCSRGHEHDHGCGCSHVHNHEQCHSHDHDHEHEHCHSHEHEHCHVHEHERCHGHEHEHCHSHEHGAVKRKDIACLITGAVLFAAALILEHANSMFVLPVCIVAYIILGREVLMASARNISHGQVFDENFLMAIATLAAFGIGDYPEAVGVMLFFNIGELFEHISVDKSRERIAKAIDMRPEAVNMVCEDAGCPEGPHRHTHETSAEKIRIGNILQINPGDRIPLDGEVVEGEGLVDTSPVTGEPTPVHAKSETKLVSGSINQRGRFYLRVTAPLEESMVSRILDSVENATENKPQVEKFITKFARIYTPIVVALAVIAAVVPPVLMGSGWEDSIMTAITFLVISCPCAMVISVPLAFFLGVGAASRTGILVKSTRSLEALRKIKIVAMDKTGTITRGTVEDTGLMEIENPDGSISFTESEGFEKSFAKKTVEGDVLKEDAAEGVESLKSLNMIPAMLTGDRKERAESIASSAGIERRNVKSELMPDGKLSALYELREEHGEIMFVGDGINDAPVLAGADIGAAMGSGADAAIESADIVFMNSNVKAISQVIKIAKKTGRIATANIVIALSIKIIVLILGFAGCANIWLAVFADTGVAMLCILNSLRLLGYKVV